MTRSYQPRRAAVLAAVNECLPLGPTAAEVAKLTGMSMDQTHGLVSAYTRSGTLFAGGQYGRTRYYPSAAARDAAEDLREQEAAALKRPSAAEALAAAGAAGITHAELSAVTGYSINGINKQTAQLRRAGQLHTAGHNKLHRCFASKDHAEAYAAALAESARARAALAKATYRAKHAKPIRSTAERKPARPKPPTADHREVITPENVRITTGAPAPDRWVTHLSADQRYFSALPPGQTLKTTGYSRYLEAR